MSEDMMDLRFSEQDNEEYGLLGCDAMYRVLQN
jgi:hypothetical protein